jgi:glutamine synthetase adenylyltransferase
MRRRLAEAHPRPSDWDFKHGAGRLLDIDLFIQAGILAVGDHGLATGSALPRLADAGWISTEEADQLCAARASLMACQAADRIVHETSPDAENPPAPGFDTLIERVGVSRADLADLTRSAAAIIERRLA